MSERESAINDMINSSTRGRTSFYYVDTEAAERMGITQFKTEASDNFVRVIPPPDPKSPWAMELYIHQHIGANDATFICLAKTFNKACPICELIERMKSENASKEAINALSSRKRYLIFVYDVRDESTVKKGLRWYDSPTKVVSNIAGLSRDKRTKRIIDVCDPVNGRDIEFHRKGQGLNTEYSSFQLIETDPIPESWYKNVPKFEEVLLVPTYEQVEAELSGTPSGGYEPEQPVGDQSTPEDKEPEPQPQAQENRRTFRGRTTSEPSQESAPAQNEDQNNIRAKLDEIRNRRR